MSAAVVSAIAVGGSLVSGFMSNKSAKKQQAAANNLQARQLEMMQEQTNAFKALVAQLPEQERAAIEDINKAYAEVNILLSEAKASGDAQSVALFEAQRDMVRTHMDAELTAIGANATEFIKLNDELSENAVKLIREDADFNDQLKQTYKKESNLAISNLKQMADASAMRVGSILKTGLPPEAAAKLSSIQQGVTDIKRKTEAVEAKLGKGGAASRITAVDLEGLKMLGETTAAFQQNNQNEMAANAEMQGRVMNASQSQMANLQTTRGRDELAAKQPYETNKLNNMSLTQSQKLTALGNANVETRKLTGAEGDASLARQDQYARDRASLVQGQAAGIAGAKSDTINRTFAGTGQQAATATSMADIMGVQAQNFSNMAMQSRAQSQSSFTQGFQGLAGGVANGYVQGTPGTAAVPGLNGTQGTAAVPATKGYWDTNKFAQGALNAGYGVKPIGYDYKTGKVVEAK